jgi:hypothetical protein
MLMFRKFVPWAIEMYSLHLMMKKQDIDGSGAISRDEFNKLGEKERWSHTEIGQIFERLDVDGSGDISKEELRGLLKIKGDRYASVTDKAVEIYARNNPDITEIDLTSCPHITDQALWVIAAICKNVTAVHVSSVQITMPALARLVGECQHFDMKQGLDVTALKSEIDGAISNTNMADLQTIGKLQLLIAAMPHTTKVMIPCEAKTSSSSITSMVMMVLRGLPNLASQGGVVFPPKKSDNWQQADIPKCEELENLTEKQFSTLFSAFKGRSMNLRNSCLSGAVGMKSLAAALGNSSSLG